MILPWHPVLAALPESRLSQPDKKLSGVFRALARAGRMPLFMIIKQLTSVYCRRFHGDYDGFFR